MTIAFKEAFMRLWSSRKTWQISIGAFGAIVTQLLGLAAIVWHWAPDVQQAHVQQSTMVISSLSALAGALLAFLTALEDSARKWGIVDPLPHEPTTTVVSAAPQALVETRSTQPAGGAPTLPLDRS